MGFMELELQRTCLDVFDAGSELVLTQEETAETIVPDYCPDIARIIHTEGAVFLHSRELRDGKAEVSGSVRVTVLYTPDGERGIRALEFAVPFTSVTDGKAFPDCAALYASADPELLETRMLNPRKVFTRCKLVLRLTGYRKTQLSFATDAAADEALCIEKKREVQQTTVLTHLAEKDFTFTGELSLSPGKEAPAEVLSSRVSGTVTEARLVDSKLVCKGVFALSVLTRTGDGGCCSFSQELPFSQILEVEGAAENAAATVRLQLTGSDIQCGGSDADGRTLPVTLYLHAMALVRQTQEVTLLSDLYSTAYDLTYQAEPVTLTDYADAFVRRQSVREVLEIGVVADSILSLAVRCGAVSVSREGETFVLRTAAVIRALYLDEGGSALLAERSADVTCQVELPEGCAVTAAAVCPEEAQGSLGERGIEVRFPVEFRGEAVSRKKRVCIASAKLDKDTPKDFSGAPSLVLRCLGKEETLWELGKRYHTTAAMILGANGVEDEASLPREKLLLIPRNRS
jgi:hypothetical protein